MPKRIEVRVAASDSGHDTIEQYFFVDSRNHIQLLFPNHDQNGTRFSKVKTLKIKEEISKQLNIPEKDFKYFKKINCISTSLPSSIS